MTEITAPDWSTICMVMLNYVYEPVVNIVFTTILFIDGTVIVVVDHAVDAEDVCLVLLNSTLRL